MYQNTARYLHSLSVVSFSVTPSRKEQYLKKIKNHDRHRIQPRIRPETHQMIWNPPSKNPHSHCPRFLWSLHGTTNRHHLSCTEFLRWNRVILRSAPVAPQATLRPGAHAHTAWAPSARVGLWAWSRLRTHPSAAGLEAPASASSSEPEKSRSL